MLKFVKYHGLILAVFAAVSTGLTTIIYTVIKSTINKQIIIQQKKLFNKIIPPDLYDNDLTAECYFVSDKALGNLIPHHLYIARKTKKLVAAVIESTAPDGYSGSIKLLIAADFNGKVLGVTVTEHHETPGLGDKIDIRISNWINLFKGKKINLNNNPYWGIKKDGGYFDQFTGATITPRAVVNAIKNTVIFIQSIPKNLPSYSKCSIHSS